MCTTYREGKRYIPRRPSVPWWWQGCRGDCLYISISHQHFVELITDTLAYFKIFTCANIFLSWYSAFYTGQCGLCSLPFWSLDAAGLSNQHLLWHNGNAVVVASYALPARIEILLSFNDILTRMYGDKEWLCLVRTIVIIRIVQHIWEFHCFFMNAS